MWCLQETPNSTTGVPPWTMVMGYLPCGPLAVLKESWSGERALLVSFGKNTTQYLRELHDKLQIAQTYAEAHTECELVGAWASSVH